MINESENKSPVVVTAVLSTDVNSSGQAIVFPQKDGHVDVTIYEIAPGASLPTHKHLFPRMGYVLSGTLRVINLKTNKTETYTRGDFALESVDEWHKGDNPGAEPVKLLVIDLVGMGAQNTVFR